MAVLQHVLISITGQGRSRQIHEVDKQNIPANFQFGSPPAEKKKKAKKNFRWRHTIKLLAWLAMSAVVLGLIAVVCQIFDGQYVPDWKQSTISAIIAWLGKLAALGIAIPLAEVMGQLKWAYFRSKDCRPMKDMDLMDGASRNPFGALNWIVRFRNGFLLHIAAIIALISFGFDPTLQYLVHYDMISNITHTPPSAAEVRQTLTYTPERGLDRGLIFAAPQPMLWGAYSSILGEGILTTYKCSSGNCTFPALQTIGLCSTCQETTASLNRNCKQLTPRAPFCRSTNDCLTSGQLCTYSSPTHNTTAGGGTTYLSLNSTGRSFQPNQGENTITINHDLVEISVVYIQPTGSANDPRAPAVPGYIPTNGSHVAQSYVCRLSYCEKTIKTTIALGQLYEEISVFDPSSTPPLTMPAITDISQITDQLFSTQLKLSEKTKISVAAVFALAQGFSRALTGKSEVATSLFPEAGEVSEFHRAMYQLLLSTPFPGMIQRITNSVTNALRIEGDIVKGDTYWHFMVVKIEYRWFAYPAICWFFVFVLVMGSSLFEFAKKRVWWGTSMLPAVMVGMPETVREELVLEHKASLGDKSEMRKKGEKVKMRIVKVDDEGELEWSMNGGREAGIFGAAFGRT